MNSNDTVGTSFPTQNASVNGGGERTLFYGNYTGTTTITTTPLHNNQWSYYPYNGQWYTPDYSLTARIAELEGQVTVLREMVAAMLSGKPTPRKRAKHA